MTNSVRWRRILARVDFTADCWLWQGPTLRGYGRVWYGRRHWLAHRLVYEQLHGPLPATLELDHLCRQPACVRPDHLEPVLHRENILRGNGWGGRESRKTHCLRGHPFSGSNLYRWKGRRLCKACRAESSRVLTGSGPRGDVVRTSRARTRRGGGAAA
jgi:hypothetical protein